MVMSFWFTGIQFKSLHTHTHTDSPIAHPGHHTHTTLIICSLGTHKCFLCKNCAKAFKSSRHSSLTPDAKRRYKLSWLLHLSVMPLPFPAKRERKKRRREKQAQNWWQSRLSDLANGFHGPPKTFTLLRFILYLALYLLLFFIVLLRFWALNCTWCRRRDALVPHTNHAKHSA